MTVNSPEYEPQVKTPEERMYDAALQLGDWEQAAGRFGLGRLSFNRNSLEPDVLLRTILNCAKEIQEERLKTSI